MKVDLDRVYEKMERYMLVQHSLPDEDINRGFYRGFYGNDFSRQLVKRKRVYGTLKIPDNSNPIELFMLECDGYTTGIALIGEYDDCSCKIKDACGRIRSTAALLENGRFISGYINRYKNISLALNPMAFRP